MDKREGTAMTLNQTVLQDNNRKLAAAIAAQPAMTLDEFLAQSSTTAQPDQQHATADSSTIPTTTSAA